MSDIVLSASVRQNLLSLQSTADLLATTQNRLATGKKVNTALDNPTNYFTAAALDNRANDINSLLDGISNGVQVLQAANTGLTSLQKLVDSAKSVANQVLQSTVGYSQKSTVTSQPVAGADPLNLLGSGGGPINAVLTGTSAITPIDLTGTPAANAKTTSTVDLSAGLTDPGSNVAFTINGQTVTLATGSGTGTGGAFTLSNIEAAINGTASVGVNATDDGAGHLVLTSTGTAGAADTIVTSGLATAGLGIADNTYNGSAAAPLANVTFQVNGQTVTLAGGASYDGNAIASTINTQVGTSASVTASYASGKLAITSNGTAGASDAVTVATFSTGDASQLGYPAGASATANGAATSGSLSGKTLTIAATGGGTPVNITFGTGAGQVSTLNALNAALLPNNLQAAISAAGVITITTSSEGASSTIGTIAGTATDPGGPFAGAVGTPPVADPVSQQARAGLIDQYNNIIAQINTTTADSSFNGINLLNGDTLKLIFNETGKSVLSITGTNTNAVGLGLSALTAGTDFLDNGSANRVIADLDKASSILRTQASTLGSNLSIVQIRQDFSKNIINVLQTGSSNLTLADTNEEAANSQALSTRQSIAVSALALANQSQQSVLQLLR
ncbi:MAG: flagellar hook protein [Rhizobiales bacterium]|nr:flagellar hook protein [Hyphomicrobiales bacterium]